MPERFEIYVVYKRRYINTLSFLFLSINHGFVVYVVLSTTAMRALLTVCLCTAELGVADGARPLRETGAGQSTVRDQSEGGVDEPDVGRTVCTAVW